MKIAIIGCGYAADLYMETLRNHPALELVAACDINETRRDAFANHYGVQMYEGVDALLSQSEAELVLNLTDPRSHYAVGRACLEAGRHLYSEKPLTTEYETALELVELAKSRGLSISGAPCNLHSETADAVRRALADGEVGTIGAVLAEMTDGPLLSKRFQDWRSASGACWPYKDEFELGSAIQHAGYCITWLIDLVGAVERVMGSAAVCHPEKGVYLPPERMGADFTVSVLEFRSGVVARVTCDLVAPRTDRSMHFIGDKGTLTVEDVWAYDSAVYFTPIGRGGDTIPQQLRRGLERKVDRVVRRVLPGHRWPGRRLRLPDSKSHLTKDARMDLARGPALQAQAIRAGHQPRISAELVLHATEVTLAMQYPNKFGSPYLVRSNLFDLPSRHANATSPCRSVRSFG